ncbi:hypothetical protein CC86DRAFT_81272 [Ophiobolus disseminans]|uniref:Uncharacterized protein n=1 Tax=Ophiobolus disseminans TaxID=1469910 RepID=A0A6A6ZQX1_9PLEO|nr:hypothetical protein CC86DRAFT_81272 [Ophiobolus disseminans]
MSESKTTKSFDMRSPSDTELPPILSASELSDVRLRQDRLRKGTGPELGSPDISPFAPDYTPKLSDLLANLSVVETGAVLEYINQWQDSSSNGRDPSKNSSIQTEYLSSMNAYHSMLPIWLKAPECDEGVKRVLYRNHVLMYDWGMAYRVPEGQLDQLPDGADDLFETIHAFLLEISDILLERIPRL